MSLSTAELVGRSAPLHADVHLLGPDEGPLLLVPNGSRIYDIDEATFAALDAAQRADDPAILQALLERLGVDAPRYVDDVAPSEPPVRALSLAVAQKCNLGCTYCYAQQGQFGGPAANMPADTARASVELLFSDVGPGERVNLSFLGGEPLLNRPVIRAATARAVELAGERGCDVTFSITTNGTRVTDDDAEFFERHAFAVTVSLDGLEDAHDALRPFRSGRGSFEAVMANIGPLLAHQRRMQVSARVTVTPSNLALRETLDAFVALGFHSVGFSPLLSASSGDGELTGDGLHAMLAGMVSCGEEFERRLVRGERYPFANAVNALREIHRGTHRPYPCGAGAGYFGVSASGELSACHRFVGDADAGMGDVVDGVDRARQSAWLDERHVHRQEPCRSCWARYLCGGGCHHEVISRGRPACDYIRGWLHWCLGSYGRLTVSRPDWFGG